MHGEGEQHFERPRRRVRRCRTGVGGAEAAGTLRRDQGPREAGRWGAGEPAGGAPKRTG